MKGFLIILSCRFKGKLNHLEDMIAENREAWRDMEQIRKGGPPRHEEFISWMLPSSSIVKINTDSAAKGNPGEVGASCELRNQNGN